MGCRIFYIVIILSIIVSCSYQFPEIEEPVDDFSGADFSQLLFFGGTFSSGLMDGAVYDKSQSLSFPTILGKKLNKSVGEEWYSHIPINSQLGYNIESTSQNPAGKFRLQYSSVDDLQPRRVSDPGELPGFWDGDLSGVSNFSFPGLTVSDAIKNIQDIENIYIDRLPLDITTSLTNTIAGHNPEIVVMSFGFDEFLNAALRGLPDEELSKISPDELFDKLQLVTELLTRNNETEIFLLNVPNIINAPFFSSLPTYYRLGEEVSPSQVMGFAEHYQEFNEWVFHYNFIENGGVSADKRRPAIDFDTDGPDRFRNRVILDESLPDAILNDGTVIPKYRQLTDEDFLLYSTEPKIRQDLNVGSVEPIENRFVLRKDQADFIEGHIVEFNRLLAGFAELHANIHLVDIFAKMDNVEQGNITFDGVSYNTGFSRYSIYSSDGYTLNGAGNALIVNSIIDSLNEQLGSNISRVNITEYPALNIFLDY